MREIPVFCRGLSLMIFYACGQGRNPPCPDDTRYVFPPRGRPKRVTFPSMRHRNVTKSHSSRTGNVPHTPQMGAHPPKGHAPRNYLYLFAEMLDHVIVDFGPGRRVADACERPGLIQGCQTHI